MEVTQSLDICSPLCSVFIRRGGWFLLEEVVNGLRQYSSDLPQGELELPCNYTVHLLESNKMKKLVKSAMEKCHLEPADNEPFLQSTIIRSHPTSMNGATTEPSVMDYSSAATQVNNLVAVDDVVCSPP